MLLVEGNPPNRNGKEKNTTELSLYFYVVSGLNDTSYRTAEICLTTIQAHTDQLMSSPNVKEATRPIASRCVPPLVNDLNRYRE